MKKLAFVALVAIAAMISSCGNKAPKADLATDIDSLSYAFGIEQSQGVRNYLEQMNIDTAYIEDFVDGVLKGAKAGDDKKQAAYNSGIAIGQQLNMMKDGFSRQIFEGDSTKELSMKNLVAGFVAGLLKKDTLMTPEKAREIGMRIATNLQEEQAAKKFAKEKKAADDFMAATAKKEGIQKLGKGVLYKVVKEGKGDKPTVDATAIIKYEGKNTAGKVFDKNDRAEMPLRSAIPGFTEALLNMPVGSVWEIYIPYSSGYGARQAGPDLAPFSALVFTVELLGIKEEPKAEAPAAPVVKK
ncbi:MAG: FKBP-type peptidyl-prolyl cis-trans isomerase [Prevotella sp.]|nr:FKBP-type peptidyl-prolyl cis-trans isomerase [Prevotella sp.]